jgi:hypothetical protein
VGGPAGSVPEGYRLHHLEPDPGPDYLSKAGPALAVVLAALAQVGGVVLVQVGMAVLALDGMSCPVELAALAQVEVAALAQVEEAVLDPADRSAAVLSDWVNSAQAARDLARLGWMKAVRGLAGFHPFDRGALHPGRPRPAAGSGLVHPFPVLPV